MPALRRARLRDGRAGASGSHLLLRARLPARGRSTLRPGAERSLDRSARRRIIHAHASEPKGYGVGIGWEGGKKGGGFHSLSWPKRKTPMEAGETYKIALELDKTSISYKVNGKALWKDKDPAPLAVAVGASAYSDGRVGIGTWGRVLYDKVKVTGTLDPKWLEAKGLPAS